jgi:hypothetical protein
MPDRVCPHPCTVTFTPKRPAQRYCSRSCVAAAANRARIKHGLYLPRQLVCPCGTPFVGKRPAATYCSNACRVAIGRYDRAYGSYEPRQYGPWREGYSA